MRCISILSVALLCASAVVAQRAPKNMSLVPGATFEMGTKAADIPNLMEKFGIRRAELFQEETPKHNATVGRFFIDKTEVTNEMFKRFTNKYPEWRKDKIASELHNGKYLQDWTDGTYPAGHDDYPVTFVSWYAAAAYCMSQGKRLPTEPEWEYAARGGLDDKQFPWGDEMPDKTRANYSATSLGGPTSVASYPANGYGLFDMAGNVWEYLADPWQKYPGNDDIDPLRVFKGREYLFVKTRRALRGGSFGGAAVNLRVTYRDSHAPENAVEHVGFRCAMSARK